MIFRADISNELEDNGSIYYLGTLNNNPRLHEASEELKQIIITLHACRDTSSRAQTIR